MIKFMLGCGLNLCSDVDEIYTWTLESVIVARLPVLINLHPKLNTSPYFHTQNNSKDRDIGIT